jgi:hypothetical protein
MRMIQRRPLALTLGAVVTAALTLLLMAARPMFRPPPRPMPPAQHAPALRPMMPAQSRPRPVTNAPAARPHAPRAQSASFNSNLSGSTPFGPASFHSSTTVTGNSHDSTFMSSTPFGSANFHLNTTLSGSINSALTATRTLSLSETINGRTASFSATNSFTLTAAQIAAAIVAERIRHSERAAVRRAVIASAYTGNGFPTSGYPSMSNYSAGSYGGGMGYGGGGNPYAGGMAYGGGASPVQEQAAAPGTRVAGNEENRPARDEQAVNRLLAASGVSDEEGQLLWPVGLRALPGDRAGLLRGQIDTLLSREKDEASTGVVTAQLQRDLTSSVDALRKQLRRDREERFSLTYQAYEDAEDYLAKLKQAANQLVKAGESATRQLRPGKPSGNVPPKAGEKETK